MNTEYTLKQWVERKRVLLEQRVIQSSFIYPVLTSLSYYLNTIGLVKKCNHTYSLLVAEWYCCCYLGLLYYMSWSVWLLLFHICTGIGLILTDHSLINNFASKRLCLSHSACNTYYKEESIWIQSRNVALWLLSACSMIKCNLRVPKPCFLECRSIFSTNNHEDKSLTELTVLRQDLEKCGSGQLQWLTHI